MTSSMPISVAHIDDGREWRGGQRQVLLLVEGLASRGHRQWVLTPEGSPLADRLRDRPDVTLIEIPGGMRKTIRHLLNTERVDILHGHRGSAHRKGLKAVRKVRRQGRVDPVPRLVTTRRVDFAIKRNPLSRRNYLDPDQHYIAISTGVRDVLTQGGVDPSRIDIVHSGIPPLDRDAVIPREEVRRELGLAPGEIAIGNVGALTDHKGQQYLIEAAPIVLRTFPHARFFIFGEGELREELQRQIERLGLTGRLRLCGYVPEISARLSGLDVYVHPSHLEGLGTAILDAMLAGLPVVAARTGGVPDVVIDGETGLLAPPRDAAALAARLIDLMEKTQAEREALADRGRRHAETHFSADAMVEGTIAVYRSLLNQRD